MWWTMDQDFVLTAAAVVLIPTCNLLLDVITTPPHPQPHVLSIKAQRAQKDSKIQILSNKQWFGLLESGNMSSQLRSILFM